MQHYVQPAQGGEVMDCGAPFGDAAGNVMLPLYWPHLTSIEVMSGGDPSNAQNAGSWGWLDSFFPQPSGFFDIGYPYLGQCAEQLSIEAWSVSGTPSADRTAWAYGQYVAAPDPRGGLLVAGTLRTDTCDSSATLHRVAVMLKGGSAGTQVRWGPQPLSASGDLVGAGVDEKGRAIVLTARTDASGTAIISAQWFDSDGTALTGEFDLFPKSDAGGANRLSATPLIGGGVLISAVKPQRDESGVEQSQTTLPLAVLESGSKQVSPLPDWIASRPNTRFQILPNDTGYSALPDGASGVDCTQRVEVLAPDGTSCGHQDYRIASGTCDTLDLQLGLDGTVLQRLPLSMETHDPYGGTFHSCTWRWWPSALKR